MSAPKYRNLIFLNEPIPFTIKRKANGAKNKVILPPVKGYFLSIPKKNTSAKTSKAIEQISQSLNLFFLNELIP